MIDLILIPLHLLPILAVALIVLGPERGTDPPPDAAPSKADLDIRLQSGREWLDLTPLASKLTSPLAASVTDSREKPRARRRAGVDVYVGSDGPPIAPYTRPVMERSRHRSALVVSAAVLSLATAPFAHSSAGPDERLAAKYSPIIMLRAQTDPPCDNKEEQYHPTVVDVVLDDPQVTLVRTTPDGHQQITKAPSGADVAAAGSRAYLNLPGNPVEPGCTYARDFAAVNRSGRAPAVTYARIVRQPGRAGLVLQYWFFYWFNQFTDLHEADWEGMQIVFLADSAQEALTTEPAEIGLFQHAGGEKARWDHEKVEKEGTHPVVFPGAGSHATFYESAIFLENGENGSGLGCDNTTEELRELRPRPRLVPTNPERDGPYGWLTYKGLWGEREEGFNTGPHGPITKTQWLRPFRKMDEMRETSAQLPGGALLGPAVTTAFCSTVADASRAIDLAIDDRSGAIALGVLGLLAVAVPAGLTKWRPVQPIPLRLPRAFGQLVITSLRLYGRHSVTLALLGLSAFLIVGLFVSLAWLLRQMFGDSDVIATVGSSGVEQPLSGSAVAIGSMVATAVASVAIITFVLELERGRTLGPVGSYRALRPHVWRAFTSGLLAQVLLTLLAITIISIPTTIHELVEWRGFQEELVLFAIALVGIPVAMRLLVDWQLLPQVVLYEDRTVLESFRGSSRLVRGQWWRALRMAVFLWLLGLISGPLLGFALVFTTMPPRAINLFGSLLFALLLPYLVLARTLLYLDLAARSSSKPRSARCP